MNTIFRKLVYLGTALALLASLGLSAAPGSAAVSNCDAQFVRRSGNVFTVYPSGGDEAANLKCAFEAARAAGPGSTVRLAAGNFRTSIVEVSGFDGYFTGAGMGKTVILPEHHMDCKARLDRNDNIALFVFRLGNPRISNLTLFVDDSEPCEIHEVWQDYFRYSLEAGFLFTGSSIGNEDVCANIRYETGKGSVDRVEAKIPDLPSMDDQHYMIHAVMVMPEFMEGLDQTQPCYGWSSQLSGEYSLTNSITRSRVSGFASQVWLGKVTVRNNKFYNPNMGYESWDTDGTVVTVEDNTVVNTEFEGFGLWANIWAALTPGQTPVGMQPVVYKVNHNTISIGGGGLGMDLNDYFNIVSGVKAVKAVISNNHILLNGTGTWGIGDDGLSGVVIRNNTIEGKADSAILMDYGSFSGGSTPIENCLLLFNDIRKFSFADPTTGVAPIYLGPNTSHCTVVGANVNDSVLDEGTDNRLIGVKPFTGLAHRRMAPGEGGAKGRPGRER